MKYKGEEIVKLHHRSLPKISWTMGNYCNFKCRYCFPGANTGDKRLPKFTDQTVENLKHLKREFNKLGYPTLSWQLSGGEPTLYHDFESFIRFVKEEAKDFVEIITNASRTVRWWRENIKYFDKVLVSHHVLEGNLDHIIDLIPIFEEQQGGTHINIMVDDQAMEQSIADYKRLLKELEGTKNIKLDRKYLRGAESEFTALVDYSDFELFEEMKSLPIFRHQTTRKLGDLINIKTEDNFYQKVPHLSLPHDLDINDGGNWEGYKCYAHHEFLQLDWFGNIHKLSCGLEIHNKVNVFDEDFVERFYLKRTAFECPIKKSCGCLGLLFTTKEK